MNHPESSGVLLAFKQFLTWVGQWLSKGQLFHLQSTLNYLKLGHWMASRGFHFSGRVRNRRQVWDVMARSLADRRALYLEFGVAGGESIRYWANALKHPESRLHGFDSFEGLPEDGGPWQKGQFSTSGQTPVVDDPRVQFFKGWFDRTLPTYQLPAHDVLVINVDADLYNSTIYVLQALRPHVRNGTFIYFDEMNHPEHEPKAFEKFLTETNLKFVPVAADKTLTYVSFRCTG